MTENHHVPKVHGQSRAAIRYAGVGSRSAPENALLVMREVAKILDSAGCQLSSGGAEGSDTAWASGTLLVKPEIYRPEKTPPVDALYAAARVHPAWNRCSSWARSAHARNVQIVLGHNLKNPVDFTLAWTKDGLMVGGTATALRISLLHNIPVINLGSAPVLTAGWVFSELERVGYHFLKK